MIRLLYRFLRYYGDGRAIMRGRYHERLIRRHAHRALARWMR